MNKGYVVVYFNCSRGRHYLFMMFMGCFFDDGVCGYIQVGKELDGWHGRLFKDRLSNDITRFNFNLY